MKNTLRLVGKIFFYQLLFFVVVLFLLWFSEKIYSSIDKTAFEKPFQIGDTTNLNENEKGKLLIDAITHQMRYELDSTFGWSANDIIFNRFLLDNRAARQFGVYHATKIFMDQYSMQIAKLGANDRENDLLYKARINDFTIDPRSFWFPSAEGKYKNGLKAIEKYKKGLDDGSAVYNCRTDDIYSTLSVMVGENMLGYALGLLENAQDTSFYELDGMIYEVQGIVLVVRDVLNAFYELYPEIKEKNNEENMKAAMHYLTLISTYDPLYITSKINCGELIISYLLFAKNRIEDIRNSLRI